MVENVTCEMNLKFPEHKKVGQVLRLLAVTRVSQTFLC